jgi:hypothetical protein
LLNQYQKLFVDAEAQRSCDFFQNHELKIVMAALAIGNQYIRNRKFTKFELLVKELDCYKDSKGKLYEAMKESSNKKDKEFQSLLTVIDNELQNKLTESRSHAQSFVSTTSAFHTDIDIGSFFSKAPDHTTEVPSQKTRAQESDSLQKKTVSLGISKPTFNEDLRFINKDLKVIEPNKELAKLLMDHCNVD